MNRTVSQFILVMCVVAVGRLGAAAQAGTNVLTLDQCIDTGLTRAPDIKAASSRLAAARSAVKSAESAYYPWVSVSSALMQSDNPPQAFMMTLNQRTLDMRSPAFDPNQPDDTANLRATVGAQYRLFDGGRRGLDHDMAKLGASAAGAGLDAVRNELVHQITRAYYGAMKAKTFISVMEESAKTAEESLRIARERYQAGAALETDVLNLEVQQSQSGEDLVRARNGLLMAVAALNAAVGSDLATPDNIIVEDRELPPVPVEGDLAGAVENRPEFKAMRQMAALRQKALGKARREYSPTISLFGSSDWDSDVSAEFEQSYTVGVMAELNIFDGFRTRSAIKEARAQADAALADQEKVFNQLKLDLVQAGIEVKDAAERAAVTRKGVISAERALQITRDRYQNGAAVVVDLVMAQTGLTAMRARDTAAHYDCRVALSNLTRARGELAREYDKSEPAIAE